MRLKLFLLSFLLFLSRLIFAQPNLPGNGPVYTSEEIPKIKIIIDEDSLNTLYLEENWYSDHEYPAQFVFETIGSSDTVASVGFRFRGNTSRDKIKKSFKVSFNTFIQGQQYFGLEKLNLNAEVNDPAMMRSRLCWELFREMGVPAPRSNHVEVFINGEYFGLYLNTEHIDEEFAELRFGSQGGNLYKCSYPADLDYLGSDPDNYKVAPWDNRTYDLKTNTEQDDYSDLAAFISFLNLSSIQDLRCGLSNHFNVYSYLKTAAVDVLTGNWDGYIYNKNNFYLYHNPTSDQFEYIPYDTDNTWGIDWLDRNWSNRNIYSWSQTGADRPLFNRLMQIDEFRDVFSFHVNDLLQNHYFTTAHEDFVNELQDFIEVSALADPYRPLDWGFDQSDFLNALYQDAGGHVDYGVLEFAEIRKNAALSQLESVDIAPIPLAIKEDFENFPSLFELQIALEGPLCALAVFNYSINGIEQSAISEFNPAGSVSFLIDLPVDFEELEYNVSLTSNSGSNRSLYCNPRKIYSSGNADLVMNEIMPSNDLTIADEAGEFDDWVEIYNSGNDFINLENYFLTDNSTSPTKWHFPEEVIAPGDFILVWADRDLGDGPLHANFRFDAGGEEVHLFKKESDGIRWIDGLEFPSTPSDFSFGRETDAQIPWIYFSNSTPGASNNGALPTDEPLTQERFIYPNPVRSILHFNIDANFRIESMDGKRLAEGKGSSYDVSALKAGMYIIRLDQSVERFIKQ